MSLQVKFISSLSDTERKYIFTRASFDLESVIAEVIRPMDSEFQKSSFKALQKYTEQIDGRLPDKWVCEYADLKQIYDEQKELHAKTIEAFIQAHKNVQDFHCLQKPKNIETEIAHNTLGVRFQPFSSVALYVPGGKALYPSTVIMGSVPAKIAEVKQILLVSPFNKDTGMLHPIVQAMAYHCQIDKVLQVGGAHGIFASVYGVPELGISPVEFVYGPGNIYVAAAKSFLSGKNRVGIDSFAGPSEVVIIADDSADPYLLAQDLMAQAEHDEQAVAILISISYEIAESCIQQINYILKEREKIKVLPQEKKRLEITKTSIMQNAYFLVADTIEDAIQFSNDFAPEHLEIQTKEDPFILSQIRNAGSIFVGKYSPVAIGDYYSGTNHILPTNGTARFASGVGVYSFYKRMTYQICSEKGLRVSQEHITEMSTAESLFDSHGYSVIARFKEKSTHKS